MRATPIAALVGAALLLGGGYLFLDRPATPPPAAPATTQARAVPQLPASPSPAAPTPSPSASPTPSPSDSSGAAFGHGTIHRFKVEVEDGIGVDQRAAADQIRNILADKRSWTTDGKNGFQLVSDEDYDFIVRIASPETVDRVCASAGLNTRGEVNCDVGPQVMVNVKRWTTGSPQFTGPIDEYRALIINHEVGHRLGHGHETCPGKGKLAPAMMQQIYGLNGCLPNAWPYTADGTLIG